MYQQTSDRSRKEKLKEQLDRLIGIMKGQRTNDIAKSAMKSGSQLTHERTSLHGTPQTISSDVTSRKTPERRSLKSYYFSLHTLTLISITDLIH